MRPEVQPWLRQAEADLQAARDSLVATHYEWTCYQAQQSGEKALKAFLIERGYEARNIKDFNHSLHGASSALEACEQLEPEFASLNNQADLLNQHSSATRYPDHNTLAGKMAPVDFYGKEVALSCITAAESILDMVRKFVTD